MSWRLRSIESPDDFTATPEGREKLDGVCMLFMAIGEALKRVDRMTDGALLARQPEVDWNANSGVRSRLVAPLLADVMALRAGQGKQVKWLS